MMMARTAGAWLICLGLLAGCTTPPADPLAAQRTRCASFGLVEGTNGFGECVAMLSKSGKPGLRDAALADDPFDPTNTTRFDVQALRTDLPGCSIGAPGTHLTKNGWAGPNCAGLAQ